MFKKIMFKKIILLISCTFIFSAGCNEVGTSEFVASPDIVSDGSSGGGAPSAPTLTVTAQLAAWYDASDSASITLNAGSVDQWNDKSGQNNHATGSSAKPSISATQLNGLNVLEFDHEFMSMTAPVAYPLTVFVVARMLNNGNNEGGFIGNSGDLSCFGNDANRWTVYNSGALPLIVNGVAPQTHAILEAVIGAASIEVYENSTLVASAGGAGAGALNELGRCFSGSRTYYGDLAEVIVYSAELGSTDRTSVRDYLNDKWFAGNAY